MFFQLHFYFVYSFIQKFFMKSLLEYFWTFLFGSSTDNSQRFSPTMFILEFYFTVFQKFYYGAASRIWSKNVPKSSCRNSLRWFSKRLSCNFLKIFFFRTNFQGDMLKEFLEEKIPLDHWCIFLRNLRNGDFFKILPEEQVNNLL